MRIPRDITGQDLIKILKKCDYIVTKQTGSHIRLTSTFNGEHHITVPNHDPLRIGTLDSIIKDLSDHLKIDKSKLLNELFSDEI